MLARSPLWPHRRPLWGTCFAVGAVGIWIGAILLAVPGAHASGFYSYITQEIPIGFYAVCWLAGGLLTLWSLLWGHRSLRWVMLGYGSGQLAWAFLVVVYAVRYGSGLGLVGAGSVAGLAVVTWLSAPAVASAG